MIQVPGLAPNPDDEENQLSPMQAPQLDAPTMSLGTRAPLQAVDGSGGGGGSAPPPAAPPMQPGIAIMQPPERSDKTEHRGEQVNKTFTQMSPEASRDIEALDTAHAKAAAARATEAGIRPTVLNTETEGQEKQADLLMNAETRKATARFLAQPKIDAAVAADEEATKEMAANRKFSDYWEDKGTPAKLFAALLVGLNQYAVTGRGMNGHNMAWEIFQNAAAADRQRKLDKFQASKEFSDLKKKDLAAAQQALQTKTNDIDNQAVAMGKAYAEQTKAIAKRQGTPAALAAADQTDAAAAAKEAETRLNQRKEYERKFTVEGERDDSGHVINTNKAPPSSGPKDLTVNNRDGSVYGQARSPEEAQKLHDANAAANGLAISIAKLSDHEKHIGRWANVPGNEAKATREALVADVTSYLTQAYETKTLNEGEYHRYNSQLNTSLTKGGDAAAKGLATILDGVNARHDAKLHALANRATPESQAATAAAPAASPRSHVETRQINGKTYVRVGGTWKVQD